LTYSYLALNTMSISHSKVIGSNSTGSNSSADWDLNAPTFSLQSSSSRGALIDGGRAVWLGVEKAKADAGRERVCRNERLEVRNGRMGRLGSVGGVSSGNTASGLSSVRIPPSGASSCSDTERALFRVTVLACKGVAVVSGGWAYTSRRISFIGRKREPVVCALEKEDGAVL